MTHWKIRCAHFRKIITQVIFFCELQRLPPTEEKDLFFRGTLPDITTANRHDSVVLHCKVGGREPTIHWLKDGVRIQQVRDIELIWAQHSGWKFSLKSNFIFKKKIFFYFNFLCVLSVLKYIYLKKNIILLFSGWKQRLQKWPGAIWGHCGCDGKVLYGIQVIFRLRGRGLGGCVHLYRGNAHWKNHTVHKSRPK